VTYDATDAVVGIDRDGESLFFLGIHLLQADTKAAPPPEGGEPSSPPVNQVAPPSSLPESLKVIAPTGD
jgi:hypothetical protein